MVRRILDCRCGSEGYLLPVGSGKVVGCYVLGCMIGVVMGSKREAISVWNEMIEEG